MPTELLPTQLQSIQPIPDAAPPAPVPPAPVPPAPAESQRAWGDIGATELLSTDAAGTAADAAPGDEAAGSPPATRPGGGILALLRKHPLAWLISAGAVVFVLLGTGSVFAGVAWASRGEPAPVDTPSASAAPARPVSDQPATAIRLRTCSVASLAADPVLMTLEGSVIRSDTGEVLFDRNAATPARTASVLAVFTAAAAVSRLSAGYQITTSVYDGANPGTIVLVGRGDATLSALPAGQESVYAGAPKLQTLAEQTIAAYQKAHPDVPITQVVLDASYWSEADKWDSSWPRSLQTGGTLSEVTALQVDGDRADPRAAVSARSTDPVSRAGAAFVDALRAADTTGDVVDNTAALIRGTAVGQSLLGEVKSQPVGTLVTQMLLSGDNTLAEMLARIVSKESGMNGSAASLQQAIPSALDAFGVPATGLTIRDGSGLSPQNAVPVSSMTSLMAQVRGGANGLDVVRGGLSVAGKTGILADRFTGDNAAVRGKLTGTSGSIDTAYALTGYVDAADGTPLAFSFVAIGDGIQSKARAALETLATAAYSCGDNLSNN